MANRRRKSDRAWEWSIFPECLIRIPDEYCDSPATASIWIAMRGEGKQVRLAGWFGVGRAVPVFPFIYSWHFQCPITHAAAREILLVETPLKPCVSNRDRRGGKPREGSGWSKAIWGRGHEEENSHLVLSFPFLCLEKCLLLKPPLAPINNEKEPRVC